MKSIFSPPANAKMQTQNVSPSLRVALKTVISDTVQEFSMLHKSLSCPSDIPQVHFSENEQSDTIFTELNQLFPDVFTKHADLQQRDLVCPSDGPCRKVSDNKSHLRAFLMELGSKINVFKTLESEISFSGTFESLKSSYKDSRSALDMPVHLAKSVMDKDMLIKFLQEKIIESQNHFTKQMESYDELIRKLKHELQEAIQLSEMTYQYSNASYKDRAAELSRIRNEETEALTDEAQGYLHRLDTEKRVIYEDSSFMLSEIAAHTNRLKYLQSQTKVQDLANDLEKLVTRLDQLIVDHKNLKTNFKEYSKIVHEYDAEQELIRQKEEHEKQVQLAICKIQAWWRTMIVVRKIKVPVIKRRRAK